VISTPKGTETVFSEVLIAQQRNRWLDREVDLRRWSQSQVRLIFETRANDAPDGAPSSDSMLFPLWGNPVVSNQGEPDRPNLILISIDCLRADHVGTYGYQRATTPSIDELAKEAVVFENAWSSSSWTIPSHMSILTGVSPSVHRLAGSPESFWTGRSKRLARSVPYLPEQLARAGYETDGVVSSAPLSPAYGFERGFALYRQHGPRASDVVDSALALSRRSKGRRQFLFVHLIDPHWPYQPAVEFRQYAETFINRFGPRPPAISELMNKVHDRRPPEHPDEIAQAIHLYDAAIAYTDQELGRLFDGLEEMGLFEPSLIVVTADHGEAFFEHANWMHDGTLYNEEIHVPLIVKWPGRLAPDRVKTPVSHVDIYPTLLEAAGLSVPSSEGVNLRDIASGAGPAPDSRHLVSEVSRESPQGTMRLIALRDANLKYIATLAESPDGQLSLEETVEEELYDLVRDPAEQRNLLAESSEEAARFSRLLRAYLEKAMRTKAEEGAPLVLDEDTDTRLQGLGYINP
jgi:arylsulfatase A-like enzyme